MFGVLVRIGLLAPYQLVLQQVSVVSLDVCFRSCLKEGRSIRRRDAHVSDI